MAVFPLLARRGLPAGLLAVLLWGAALPGTVGAAGAPTLVLESCGALLREPGLGDGWPAGRAVRPGQAVLPGDKGLGCRFALAGAGAGAVVEARLVRPAAGGGQAEDRWFVPVRRGEAASASYVFAPGQAVPAGDWTLTLAADGLPPAVARFETSAGVGEPAAIAPAPVRSGPPPDVSAPRTAGPFPGAAPTSPAGPDQTAGSSPVVAPPPRVVSSGEAAPAGTTTTPALAATPSRSAGPAAAPLAAAAARTEKPRAGAETKSAPATGYVALQTGLFADADNAAAQAARLRARGMPACLAVSGAGAKRRYRVLAGRFGDRRAAAAARGDVAAILGVTPILSPVEAAEVSGLRCR